jgi:hypothetical protein
VAELSWEDFWAPVSAAQDTTVLSQRLQLATTSGYRSWLQRTYSLASVSKTYGSAFSSWADVPTPLYTQPSFKLMYQYDDWAVVHRFYDPAAKRFPGLNLEARVDIDPIHNGTTVVGSYGHDDTFQLPGTSYIGMYFSPYQGDPSSALVETSQQGLAALQNTLSSMHTRSGGRPLFIFEYEIVSNSLAVANDPGLPPSQVPSFVLGSEPILKKYAIGYSLWVYQDYHQSPLYNPSFGLGTAGWKVTGKATTASNSLSLGAGASVSQAFSIGDLGGGTANELTVSMTASTPTSAPATVDVSVAGSPAQSITVQGGTQTYQVEVPAADLANGSPTAQLSISTKSPVTISDVQAYDFTQVGDIYSPTDAPEVGAASLRTLNHQLVAGGTN